ncbi:MAG: helix-turn-helix transcriptional regulator [Planctomycetes bacterium]|nr:helix-turn-helix transcriptional regulator [Planctomycetota bacterium]
MGFKHFFSPPVIDSPLLQIRGIGVHERMQPCRVFRPHGTGDYLFMLFHAPVRLSAGGSEGEVSAETLVLWPPGAGHDYGASGGDWDHSWIHCNGERVREALRSAELPLDHPLTPSEPESFVRDLEKIYEELTGPHPDSIIAGNLLENTLRKLSRGLGRPPQPGRCVPEAFLGLRQQLARHPQQIVCLADLARAVNLSVPHFSAQWKRHFQVSPIEDLIRMRIERAKYLLLDNNRRVCDIADAVGIADAFRFSKLFRQRVGLSPRAYRATLAKPSTGPGTSHNSASS